MGRALENDHAYPEIAKLAQELRDKGIKAVILSNTVPPHGQLIKKWGWYRPFYKIYLSYEIGFRKPDKRAYQIVLDDLGLKGEECVMVDNIEEDLVPARELGMRTVLAINPGQVVRDVREKMV